MVLESMINPKNAEDKPWHVFFIAIIYTFVAVFFSNFLFPSQASVLTIAMITIIFVPFFQKLFAIEEEKDELQAEKKMHKNMWSRHSSLIFIFSAFFLGIIVAMSFIFIFIPSQNIFQLQTEAISGIATGNAAASGNFEKFFFNNTQVMILTFVLSLLFGAGSIFILSWNASVIAVYIGYVINSLAEKGYTLSTAYVVGVPAGIGTIILHGIPEVVAYFLAGLAGGILSVGILREKWGSKEFNMVLADGVKIFLLAEILILAAAIIEAL
ncbi:stage II sporulation protein M [archaeon]|nr:stage II sporulation protein M [archaeon]